MKKKILMLCLATGLVLSISAQEKMSDKDLPAPVQTNFKSQFTDASGTEWKMKDGKYKAHFKVNGTKQIAAYDAAGVLLSKGVEIKESELPSAIGSSIKTSYANRGIDEIYKVDKNGSISYMVKLKGSPETKMMYSADGQLIKE